MFEGLKRRHRIRHIDLASIRDTLLYIEHDLESAPELHRIADGIRAALAEIDCIELCYQPHKTPDITVARFVPVTL